MGTCTTKCINLVTKITDIIIRMEETENRMEILQKKIDEIILGYELKKVNPEE